MRPNPFTAGPPVGGTSAFVGRRRQLERIITSLSDAGADRIIVLEGSRRLGKTSLLRELEARAKSGQDLVGVVPLFLDFMRLHRGFSVAEVAVEWAAAIAAAVDLAAPGTEDLRKPVTRKRWFNKALRLMQGLGLRLLLLLDELPLASKAAMDRAYSPSELVELEVMRGFVLQLRERAPKAVRLVFAFGPYVRHDDVLAQLVRDAIWEKVRFFSSPETGGADFTELISLGEPELAWTPEAQQCLWAETRGHPFLTMSVAAALWDAHWEDTAENEGLSHTVTEADVNAILVDHLDTIDAGARWVWNAAQPFEQLALAALAFSEGPVPQSEGALRELLRGTFPDLRHVPEALSTAFLEGLLKWDYVELSGGNVQLQVPLVRRWIRDRRAPDDPILRKLFDELDAEAAKLFDKLKSADLEDKAGHGQLLAQLRRVLERNPSHRSARRMAKVVQERRGRNWSWAAEQLGKQGEEWAPSTASVPDLTRYRRWDLAATYWDLEDALECLQAEEARARVDEHSPIENINQLLETDALEHAHAGREALGRQELHRSMKELGHALVRAPHRPEIKALLLSLADVLSSEREMWAITTIRRWWRSLPLPARLAPLFGLVVAAAGLTYEVYQNRTPTDEYGTTVRGCADSYGIGTVWENVLWNPEGRRVALCFVPDVERGTMLVIADEKDELMLPGGYGNDSELELTPSSTACVETMGQTGGRVKIVRVLSASHHDYHADMLDGRYRDNDLLKFNMFECDVVDVGEGNTEAGLRTEYVDPCSAKGLKWKHKEQDRSEFFCHMMSYIKARRL
jgi:hypothetical protein